MKHCENCEYWGKKECDSSRDILRFCRMMMGRLEPNIVDVGADDNYNLQCMTAPNFGCTLFKPTVVSAARFKELLEKRTPP